VHQNWSAKLLPAFRSRLGELENPFNVPQEHIKRFLEAIWDHLFDIKWNDLLDLYQNIAKNIVSTASALIHRFAHCSFL
jgi:hypothetical protein